MTRAGAKRVERECREARIHRIEIYLSGPDRFMTALRTTIARIFQQEDINFLLTNRIPRRLLTQFMGWFSKIEQPLVRDASIGLWRLFSDLDLSEAKKTEVQQHARLLHRELKDGRAAGRSGSRRLSSAPAMRSSAPAGGSTAPSCCRSRAFPTRWKTCWAHPSWWSVIATASTSRCG